MKPIVGIKRYSLGFSRNHYRKYFLENIIVMNIRGKKLLLIYFLCA